MAIITLTSDWGHKDHYLGIVKGKIIKNLPDASIVDLSHNIPPFNSIQAAFVLKNCYREFPEGTIHIIAINTEETEKFPHTIVYAAGQYFIGTDDGIFSLIIDEKPEKIIEINLPQDSGYFTFSTKDRFIKTAAEIAGGAKLEDLGNTRTKLNKKISFAPVTEKNIIKGMVVYIDNYENVITNISEKQFNQLRKGREYNIMLRSETIKKIHNSYTDVPVGEIAVLFNTSGLLEIAINKGNASSLLGLYLNETIRIEFKG